MRWGDLMGDDDGVKVPDFDLLTLDNEKRAISLDFTGREAALIAVSFTCLPLDLLKASERADLAALAERFMVAIDEQIAAR